MALVKVWNDNSYDHKEKFRDEELVIPAKKYILMQEDDALLFKGQYTPMVLMGDKTPDPRHFKMLRLEKHDPSAEVEAPKVDETKCIACNYKATSKTDLTEHMNATHAENLVKDEELDKELERKKKKAG